MMLLLLACTTPTGDEPDTGAADSGADTAESAETGDSADTADTDTGEAAPPFAGLHLSPPGLVDPSLPYWARVADAAARTGGVVFVDPSNGPGTSEIEAWSTAVADARFAGARVVGFVDTDGGTRDAGDVERDLGRWFAWYEVDGAWFDTEGATDCAAATAAHAVSAAEADSRDDDDDALVAVRTAFDCEGLTAFAELVVVSEPFTAFTARSPWPWAATVGPERLVAWVTAVPPGQEEAALTQARALGFGHVWITDQSGAEPFGVEPQGLDAVMALVLGAPG